MTSVVFTTRGNVSALLQEAGVIATGIQQDSLDRAILAATAAIRNYTKQVISYVSEDTIALDGTGNARMFIPEHPVLAVDSVTEDGELLVQGTDYEVSANYGILYRINNKKWAQGYGNIEIVYSHGYVVIPDDIVDVATRAASRMYQAGLRASDTGGIAGVTAKSLGDFSVSYSGEHGGGAGEGVMGASASRPLLMSEKDLLNNYRIKRI